MSWKFFLFITDSYSLPPQTHIHLLLSLDRILELPASILKSIILQVKDIYSPNLETKGNKFIVSAHDDVLWIKKLIYTPLWYPIFFRRSLLWHVHEACLANAKCIHEPAKSLGNLLKILNLNLYFNETLKQFVCTLQFEKHYSKETI